MDRCLENTIKWGMQVSDQHWDNDIINVKYTHKTKPNISICTYVYIHREK